MSKLKRFYVELEKLLEKIIDNRGKSVPTSETGIPLIATNCIKHSSIYPTYENIRFVSKEVYQSWFKAHLKPNDILFVNKGTPGRACLVPDPVGFCAAQDMVGLRFNNKVDYKYMLALLRSNEIQKTISNNHVGLVIAHFRKQELVKLKIPIIELEIQKKIGQIYFDLSYKIELNNKINAELEAMAKTLYNYWFVQFDFPDANGKPYKSSGGKMVYNAELKRVIPEGWEVKHLADIANITMGQSPEGTSYNEIGQGIIFYQGSTDFGWRFPTNRQYSTKPTRFAKSGDILLSVRAPVGTFNIANEDCCIGRGLSAINSKQGFNSFLICQMRYFKKKFDNINFVGTTFGSINKDDLYALKLCYPQKDILEKFERVVSNFDHQILTNFKQNQTLASLRDWLLPMLMNGQVTVNEAYQQAAEAVSMAAESTVEYIHKKKSKASYDNYYKIQILYTTIWANKSLNVRQGEMATAKDVYLLDKIYGVESGFQFAQHNWGSFDPKEKQLLNTTQYFHKPNFPNSKAFYIDLKDDGKLLEKIPDSLKNQINKGISEMDTIVFHKYSGTKKAEMKELYATVLKCMEDKQSTDFSIIRDAMTNWAITQHGKELTKADKFSEAETKEALDVIIRGGWEKNVLSM